MKAPIKKQTKLDSENLTKKEILYRKTIEYGILGLIIFTPLPAAAVYEWSILIVQLTVLLMMIAYFMMKNEPQNNRYLARSVRWPKYLFSGFFVLLILQVIPFPVAIVRIISPHSYSFRESFSVNLTSQKFMSISLIHSHTLKAGLELLSYFLIGFLIIRTVRKKQIKRICYTLVCMGIFQAFYGMFELTQKNPRILFYKKIYNLDSVTGTFVNRNHFAGYLEMVLPLAIGLVLARIDVFSMPGLSWRQKLLRLSEKGLATITLLLFGIIAMSLAIIFSKSRSGAFLLAYTFFLFFGLSALYFRDVKKRDKRIMNILKVIFLAVIVLSLYGGIGSTLERFSLNEIMQEGRPAIWATTIQIFTDFPLFGSGLGTFASIYPGLESWGEPVNIFHAHNDYLEYLSELGIVGMSMLLGGIVLLLVNSFLFWKERRHREVKGLALGGMVAIVCILLHSITDFNLHIPANMMLFSIILPLTLVIATYRYRKSDEKKDIVVLKDQISKIIAEKEKVKSV